jgi:hypothetical protein
MLVEMKCLIMADRKNKPPAAPPRRSNKADAAFDLFLKRGLHDMFDKFAEEPVPPELLKLLEDDKNK